MGCGAASRPYQEISAETCAAEDAQLAAAARPKRHQAFEPQGWQQQPQPHPQVQPQPAPQPQPAARGEWQVEEAAGEWRPLPSEVGDQLLSAYYSGESRVLYISVGTSYEVDFAQCVQTNRRTGAQQRVRWGAARTPAGEVVAGAGAAPQASGQVSGIYETRYQWELKNGAWADYDDEEQQCLLAAWMMGKNSVRYSARGFEYEIDFFMMRQTNATLGQVRQVRVKPRQAWEAPAGPREPPAEPPDPAPEAEAPPEGGAPAQGPKGAGRGARRPVTGPSKKFSLRPGGPPAAGPAPQGPAAQGAEAAGQGPRPEAKPAAAGARPAPEPATALPVGVAWPADTAARAAAAAVFAELCGARLQPADGRRAAYKSACLAWHPDKNLDREDLATEVFQFLQSLRAWYFEG